MTIEYQGNHSFSEEKVVVYPALVPYTSTIKHREYLRQGYTAHRPLFEHGRNKLVQTVKYSREVAAITLHDHSKAYEVSVQDTTDHINKVRMYLDQVVGNLTQRAIVHDESKLAMPELHGFAVFGPRLKNMEYMSDEYEQCRKEMDETVAHHYKYNSHHPEHYPEGINDMSLLDIIEMLTDWKAASERHANGNIYTSLSVNIGRFGINPQLADILYNTIKELYPHVVEPMTP